MNYSWGLLQSFCVSVLRWDFFWKQHVRPHLEQDINHFVTLDAVENTSPLPTRVNDEELGSNSSSKLIVAFKWTNELFWFRQTLWSNHVPRMCENNLRYIVKGHGQIAFDYFISEKPHLLGSWLWNGKAVTYWVMKKSGISRLTHILSVKSGISRWPKFYSCSSIKDGAWFNCYQPQLLTHNTRK
jgi:hypothetical protein